MKRILFLLGCLSGAVVQAQGSKTENVILVTLDGFRWQELFNGADDYLIFNTKYTGDTATVHRYWDTKDSVRRMKLMPFMWHEVGAHGQIYGNREYRNHVNCANPYWFSYPGYSEMLCGRVDRRMSSNRKVTNPNTNVMEYIHGQPGYEGKVAAFSTWDVIPYVIRSATNGIYTSQSDPKHADVHSCDETTFEMAFDYLKEQRPKMMFLSLDGTDHHAHGGRYDDYLNYAHLADSMISTLWNWMETQEQYRGKTTLIITTDHGRGRKNAWKTHGRWAMGSNQMWMAVLGPDTPPLGEIKTSGQYYQKQIAGTLASFLGLNFGSNDASIAEVIGKVFYPQHVVVAK